jgi:VWFA-related protein
MIRAFTPAGAALAALALGGSVLLPADAQQPPVPPPQQQQTPPPPPDPQRQIFRTDTHLVRVDAYPSKDGKIIEGLTAADFEVLEDGKPQQIENLQFIDFSSLTPETERRDPNSQRDGFNLAADPRYRVFVIYLDIYNVGIAGSHATRRPLVDMLNRMLGPRDLFGVLTPRQEPMRDLMLGQQTLSIEEQLARHWTWGVADRLTEREPEELQLEVCFPPQLAGELIFRRRLDKVLGDLEEVITMMEGLREERKNIILFSGGWRLPRSNTTLAPPIGQALPPIGITNAGKPVLGTRNPGEVNTRWCNDELNRLAAVDFLQRHRDMLRSARRANVTFYPVNPMGLEASASPAGIDDINRRTDVLRELAQNTDGVAIVDSNDLRSGLQRVADDLRAYYVLAYYTTNTKWDGQTRRITVKLKPSGSTIRSRREYRAPTEAEMAALRNPPASAVAKGPSPVEEALGALSRMRPAAALHTYGRVFGTDIAVVAEIPAARIEAGRWKNGGEIQVIVTAADGEIAGTGRARFDPGSRGAIVRVPASGQPGPWIVVVRVRAEGEEPEEDRLALSAAAPGLLGDPLVFRAAPAPASPLRPVAGLFFRRTERVAVEWPLNGPIDRRQARLLGRDGKPLPIDVAVSERSSSGIQVLAADLNLAPLTAGDYLIEVTAGTGETSVQKLIALRVGR